MMDGPLRTRMAEALREHLATSEPMRLPAGGATLWRAFLDLDSSRSYHANGPNPIPYTEIRAYCALMNLPLEPHHVAVIRDMDDEVLIHYGKKLKQAVEANRSGQKHMPGVSSQPLTPALFDAILG
jgi:hypothetical protein